MSLSPEELRLHRELIVHFNEYIRHNLRWEAKRKDIDARRARKSLRKLIDIAYLRWRELNNERKKWDEEPLVIAPEFFRQLAKKQWKSKKTGDDNTST